MLRHLSAVAAAFLREHEHIHLHTDLRPAPIDLAGGNYDLAISIDEPKGSSLIVRKIAHAENGVFAAPSYLAAHGRLAALRDLSFYQVILPRQGTMAEWSLTRGETSATVSVKGPISCNSLSLARQFAVNG